jgi:anaphase-promoting complex subunit 10
MSDVVRSAGIHSSPSLDPGSTAEGVDEAVSPRLGGEDETPVRELGGEAMWSISSAKPGNGVDQLRDGNLATYWQSDGSAPHIVTIQFLRNTSVSSLDFYVNFSLDESYTPKRVVVRAGSSVHDLVDAAAADIPQDPEPSVSPPPSEEGGGGRWVRIPLTSQDPDRPGPLRAHVLQVYVHQLKIFIYRKT